MTPILLHDYRTPRVKPGHTIACQVRGEVEVDGLTEGSRSTAEPWPIAWPYVAQIGGRRSLILCGDLVKAVRREGVSAIAKAWGVSRDQVHTWRRALGVPRFNEGTRATWTILAPAKCATMRAAKGPRPEGSGR